MRGPRELDFRLSIPEHLKTQTIFLHVRWHHCISSASNSVVKNLLKYHEGCSPQRCVRTMWAERSSGVIKVCDMESS